MARFAGQAVNQEITPRSQRPVVPGFNAEDLKEAPGQEKERMNGSTLRSPYHQ